MDTILVKNREEKKFDLESCVLRDIQICLDCSSEKITFVENKIHCESCGIIKFKYRIRDLV